MVEPSGSCSSSARLASEASTTSANSRRSPMMRSTSLARSTISSAARAAVCVLMSSMLLRFARRGRNEWHTTPQETRTPVWSEPLGPCMLRLGVPVVGQWATRPVTSSRIRRHVYHPWCQADPLCRAAAWAPRWRWQYDWEAVMTRDRGHNAAVSLALVTRLAPLTCGGLGLTDEHGSPVLRSAIAAQV